MPNKSIRTPLFASIVLAVASVLVVGITYLTGEPSRLANRDYLLDIDASFEPAVEDEDGDWSDDTSFESDEEALALRAIDEIAAHPDDPQKPRRVPGVSDEELAQTSIVEVAELIELCAPHAIANRNTPRYLFQLGRAALLHEMDSYAEEYLTMAAEAGSVAAQAHLAYLTDGDEAEGLLRSAAGKGFAPATQWLAEWEAAHGSSGVSDKVASGSGQVRSTPTPSATSSYDPETFTRPDLIAAFHSQDFSKLPQSRIAMLAYITAFIQKLHDQSLLYLVAEPENQRKLLTLQDPGFLEQAQFLVASNPAFTRETSQLAVKQLGSLFGGIVDVRKRGGTIEEEMSETMKRMGAVQTPILGLKQQGDADGFRITLLLSDHYADARKIVDGMKAYLLKMGTDTSTPSGGGPTMGEAIDGLLGKPRRR